MLPLPLIQLAPTPSHLHTHTHTSSRPLFSSQPFSHLTFGVGWCLSLQFKYCGGHIHSWYYITVSQASKICLKFIQWSTYLKFLQHLELQRVLKRSFFFFFFKIFWCGPFLKSSLNLLQSCFCFTFFFFLIWEACGNLSSLTRDRTCMQRLHWKVKP